MEGTAGLASVTLLEAAALAALLQAASWWVDKAGPRCGGNGRVVGAWAGNSAGRRKERFERFFCLPQAVAERVVEMLDLRSICRVSSVCRAGNALVRRNWRRDALLQRHASQWGLQIPRDLKDDRLHAAVLRSMERHYLRELTFFQEKRNTLALLAQAPVEAVVPSQVATFETAELSCAVSSTELTHHVVFVANSQDGAVIKKCFPSLQASFISLDIAGKHSDALAITAPPIQARGFIGYAKDLIVLKAEHEKFRPGFFYLLRNLSVWKSAKHARQAIQNGSAPADLKYTWLNKLAEASSATLVLPGPSPRPRFSSARQVDIHVEMLLKHVSDIRTSAAAYDHFLGKRILSASEQTD